MTSHKNAEPMPVNGQSPLPQTSSSALNAESMKVDPQFFTGNPLERSLDVLQKFDGSAAPGASAEVSLIVVSGRSICVRNTTSDVTNPNIDQDLQALLLGINDPQLDLNSEFISFVWQRGQCMSQTPWNLMVQPCFTHTNLRLAMTMIRSSAWRGC
jgi:hypothetical protein